MMKAADMAETAQMKGAPAMFHRMIPWYLLGGLIMVLIYGCLAGAADNQPVVKPDPPEVIKGVRLAKGEKLIGQWSGKGECVTTPFIVRDDWRLEFKARDNPMSSGRWLSVRDVKAKKGAWMVPNHSEEFGEQFDRGGEYAICVKYPDGSRGLWRIRVIQGTGRIDD